MFEFVNSIPNANSLYEISWKPYVRGCYPKWLGVFIYTCPTQVQIVVDTQENLLFDDATMM